MVNAAEGFAKTVQSNVCSHIISSHCQFLSILDASLLPTILSSILLEHYLELSLYLVLELFHIFVISKYKFSSVLLEHYFELSLYLVLELF